VVQLDIDIKTIIWKIFICNYYILII
jgi:hypothetical protein